MINKIYCDECGEIVNGSYIITLKDNYGDVDQWFCSEYCLEEYLKDRVTLGVYVTEEGIIEK